MTDQEIALKALEIASRVGDGQCWCFEIRHYTDYMHVVGLCFQSATQQQARALRQAIGAPLWKKELNEGCGWWEYHANVEGVPVKIYAVTEAPPSCRMIEEEYTTTEAVPVAFEDRQVTKTRRRWECAPEEPVSA